MNNRVIPNTTSPIFKCYLCNASMFNFEPGDNCYVITKQKASLKDVTYADGTQGEQIVFNLNKIGFRFCESCWEAIAGERYKIDL